MQRRKAKPPPEGKIDDSDPHHRGRFMSGNELRIEPSAALRVGGKRLTPRQLEVLLAVHSEGSQNRAASRLGISTSVVASLSLPDRGQGRPAAADHFLHRQLAQRGRHEDSAGVRRPGEADAQGRGGGDRRDYRHRGAAAQRARPRLTRDGCLRADNSPTTPATSVTSRPA